MKIKIILFISLLAIVLSSCQSAVTTPTNTATPLGQMETLVAATIYAQQTSTAMAEQAFHATLTAAIPTQTDTPVPTPTPNSFTVRVLGSACWMDSGVTIQNGQKVLITASGTVHTWGGRNGSDSDPNGQTGLCGAIQCPKQGVGYGALIGRLEDQPTFFVGTKYEFTASQDGQLYFTVNDWECDDNNGVFQVRITFP